MAAVFLTLRAKKKVGACSLNLSADAEQVHSILSLDAESIEPTGGRA
jgi:hypothetical protein